MSILFLPKKEEFFLKFLNNLLGSVGLKELGRWRGNLVWTNYYCFFSSIFFYYIFFSAIYYWYFFNKISLSYSQIFKTAFKLTRSSMIWFLHIFPDFSHATVSLAFFILAMMHIFHLCYYVLLFQSRLFCAPGSFLVPIWSSRYLTVKNFSGVWISSLVKGKRKFNYTHVLFIIIVSDVKNHIIYKYITGNWKLFFSC